MTIKTVTEANEGVNQRIIDLGREIKRNLDNELQGIKETLIKELRDTRDHLASEKFEVAQKLRDFKTQMDNFPHGTESNGR